MKTNPIYFILAILLLLPLVQAIEINVDDYTIDYSYTKAVSGERFYLTITITNEANNTKEDIDLNFADSYPFNFISDEDLNIESLAPDESIKKTFQIEVATNADSNNYDLEFELDNEDSFLDIEVTSIKPELIITDISVEPKIISPDQEDVHLTLKLGNIGDGEANFVKAEIILPSGFTASDSYSTQEYLGSLSKSDNKSIDFYFDTDKLLASGPHQARLNLQFEDEDHESYQVSLPFNLPVIGKPVFAVVNSDLAPQELHSGSKAVLGITLQNIGTEDGKETSVRIFENSDLPFKFDEKTNYIGSIDSQELGRAVFNLVVDSDATPNNYWVKIQIRTVDNGNVLVTEDKINIAVVAKEPLNLDSVLLAALLVLIFLTAVLIIFLLFKKGKRKRR